MNCLVIASSYVGATMLGGGAAVTIGEPLLNPFIALGLCLWSGKWNHPQYILFPWIGSIFSLVFYELIFVRTLEELEGGPDDEEESKDLELD